VKIKKFILVFSLWSLVLSLVGCDAFVRKFTRKPKKEQYQREEIVLAPQEYKPTMSREEQYRQYFLFWKSWQDELINSLVSLPDVSPNHKKQIDCANEAIKNLLNMRPLLNDAYQKKLDVYLGQMTGLRDLIAKDNYGTNVNSNRYEAERLKRDILQNFSFNAIKNSLR